MEFLLSMQGNSLTPMIIAEEVLTILTGIFVYTKSDLFVRKILQNWTRFESLITTCFKENNLAAVSSLFQLLKTVFLSSSSITRSSSPPPIPRFCFKVLSS